MASEINVLPATAEDYEEVMSISGGIYKGTDYLPYRYHAWLKDPRRRMYLAKCDDKVVGFESFLLVDGGVTAVVEGLRVAPWMRGQGVAGIIQNFCINAIRADHPEVKTVSMTRTENPPPSLLKKYSIINCKAIIFMHLPSDQVEEGLKLLESRVDNSERSINHSVLGPTEVLKLFERTKLEEELLPGRRLVQCWLPLTTHKANLELLLERRIVWLYCHPCDTGDFLAESSDSTTCDTIRCQTSHEHSAITASTPTSSDSTSTTQSHHNSAPPPSSINTSSPRFLSLGTPPFPIPLAKGTHKLDIDLFGNDPECAKIHVLKQLKMGIQALPAGGDIICVLYAEESLRAALNDLCEGLATFFYVREQMVLDMEI
ncbi:histidine N-acetyltransferase-like [Pseudophryne corroboree]|uniref:histidine N-acetyltransferase-like n=1 Tax=Pseudophryne corroboree TaxID=495146 RepID=UPI003081BE97